MNHAPIRASALALALASVACTSTLDLDVKLVTRSCDPQLNPMKEGDNTVTHLRFTVTGDGIDSASLQTTMDAGARELTVPAIPIGPNVNLRVEALLATGAVVSVGQTGPMNLEERTDALPVAIFLRRTNVFTPTASADAQTACSQLLSPRAGHSTTVLSDGRVLIAGGFYDDDGGLRYHLKSTEFYDPRTGEVTPGPNMNQERAYHTATHIPGTKYTVLAGGERRREGEDEALRSAEIFNEEFGVFDHAVMKVARTRHAAALPRSGGLLALIGGYGDSGPLASVETFDPRKLGTSDGPFAEEVLGTFQPRAEASAVGIGAGLILIAGGYDGAGLMKTTTLLRARDTGIYDVVEGWDVELSQARAAPMIAALDDNTVVVTGGFSSPPPGAFKFDASNADATNVTDVIHLNGGIAGEVISLDDTKLKENRARGGIVSLGDGRALVAGGASKSTGGATGSTTAELLYVDTGLVNKAEVASELRDPRYNSAWTLLQDGTVLVTGGLEQTDSGVRYLRTLEVFQPVAR